LNALQYDGVTSFRGNKVSQVNYTKTKLFYAMKLKLLCVLKLDGNFIFAKYGAKRLCISLEIDRFWCRILVCALVGDEVGLPSFCATTATKTVLVAV
jgi:hypothetical protein